jgi:hypothetical protein
MINTYSTRDWQDSDPAPDVPTPEEIRYAEEIRRRLEARLLPRTEWPPHRFGAAVSGWVDRYGG